MLDKDFSFQGNRSLQSLNRLLIIAPHHDDESIGAGGFIADYNHRGGESHVITIYSGESGIPDIDFESAQQIRKQELLQAAKILGIVHTYGLKFADRSAANQADITKALIPFVRKIKPGIIITPHLRERDPEHAMVAKATREAAWLSATKIFPELGEPCPVVQMLLGYEVWTPIENPQLFIDISQVINIKLDAIKAHKSQIINNDWVSAAKGLAHYRGTTSGHGSLVEAFELCLMTPESLLPWYTAPIDTGI